MSMSKTYIEQLANLLQMLQNLDRDLNLVTFNETEKKIYYTIAYEVHNKGKCNISDLIESSGFSRSTVYKAIKAFEDKKMVRLIQSHADRREIFLDLVTV
jgi:DNA-binding MarR family transcriptional regulator